MLKLVSYYAYKTSQLIISLSMNTKETNQKTVNFFITLLIKAV